MALYGKVEYWDARYEATTESSGPCEWYRSYSHLRHLLNPIYFATSGISSKLKHSHSKAAELQHAGISRNHTPEPCTFPPRDQSRILIVGCGNSTLGYDMMCDGWTGSVVNVDFSSVVIQQMQHRYVDSPSMKFVCADVTKPMDEFSDGSFDLIVCKGTLDAILCATKEGALALVKECTRLLAPGHGILFLVTNGNPDNRLEYLEHNNNLNHNWRGVSVHLVENGIHDAPSKKPVYCYICRKRRSVVTGKENDRNDRTNVQANAL